MHPFIVCKYDGASVDETGDYEQSLSSNQVYILYQDTFST